MKEDLYTSIICERYCNYYKPGKENEVCNSYFYLKYHITPSELNNLIKIIHPHNDEISKRNVDFICQECDFRKDGCDFFIEKSPNPCGGYLIISKLFNYMNY